LDARIQNPSKISGGEVAGFASSSRDTKYSSFERGEITLKGFSEEAVRTTRRPDAFGIAKQHRNNFNVAHLFIKPYNVPRWAGQTV
jgi:hypothetical protein